MSRCEGRCTCHAADWEALDRAAGIKSSKASKGRGRTRFSPDERGFRQSLAQHYKDEWDAMGHHADYLPTMTAVADRFMYSERTLRRNLQRYKASWPPGDEDPHHRDLRGSAHGTSGAWGTLTRRAA